MDRRLKNAGQGVDFSKATMLVNGSEPEGAETPVRFLTTQTWRGPSMAFQHIHTPEVRVTNPMAHARVRAAPTSFHIAGAGQ
jgi:hypothetical protein